MESALRSALQKRGEPPGWFDRLADAVIRRSVLVVDRAGFQSHFAVVEVEFYLNRPGHLDPSVHCDLQQLSCGQWYFHREKAAKIGFTLKGLDLTLGADREYGGMLLRAIARPDGAGIIEGPSKVVDAILIAAGVQSVIELKAVPGYDNRALLPTAFLRLEPRIDVWFEDIRAGRRVGLKNAGSFTEAQYRYRARAALTKRDRLGIAQGRIVPHRSYTMNSLLNLLEEIEKSPREAPRLTDAEVDAFLADFLADLSDEALIGIEAPDEDLAEASDEEVTTAEVWGVVGYRHFTDFGRLSTELNSIVGKRGWPCRVVSGGAAGTDTMAKTWAQTNDIEVTEYLPASSRPEAFLARNSQIVAASTHIVAFLSSQSKGTKDTIAKARKAGKPVTIIKID